MRQKFGASNGLRSGSGGGMAGIGSDPNYRPGQSGGSGHSRGKYSILCVFFLSSSSSSSSNSSILSLLLSLHE